jgi:hypothetical protein
MHPDPHSLSQLYTGKIFCQTAVWKAQSFHLSHLNKSQVSKSHLALPVQHNAHRQVLVRCGTCLVFTLLASLAGLS